MKLLKKNKQIIHELVKRPTSESDLINLAASMGMSIGVDRLVNIGKRNEELLVLNLDPHGSGTHWVACNFTKKKPLYFDPYAFNKPKEVNSFLEASKTKQLQSLQAKDCGPLCVLWLWYTTHYDDGNKRFYDEFKDVYRG